MNKPLVWVLIPHFLNTSGQLTPGYDKRVLGVELAGAFAELDLPWVWQPITADDQETVIARIAAACRQTPGIVLNLCDGCDGAERGGYPGAGVIALLTAHALPFTGAGLAFYHLTNSKITARQPLAAAGVPAPPYARIADPGRDIPGVCARLGAPLIVKPAVSCAAQGLTLQSVVHTDAEIFSQVEALLAGRHALVCPPGAILVERFIRGSEFTVFIVGSARPGHIRHLYPPLEKVFFSALPDLERFTLPLQERSRLPPLPDQNGQPSTDRYYYRLADAALVEPLCDLSRRAYGALEGTGYARIDIRMDRDSGELFVLEVNANPQLSADPDETPIGEILRLTGASFAGLVAEILDTAHERAPAALRSAFGESAGG